jgi:hypothetical protein
VPSPNNLHEKHVVLAVSATELQGTYTHDPKHDPWKAVRDAEPLDVLGGSIYLYQVR